MLYRRNNVGHKLITVMYFCIMFGNAVIFVHTAKQKRQLFRENILPKKGGKVPEFAFEPERLFLNRLDQQGISVPDGVVPNQRPQVRDPFQKMSQPETLKVPLHNDGRYVAPPGQSHYSKPPTVDTTYTIRPSHKLISKGVFVTSRPSPVLMYWWNIHRGTSMMHKPLSRPNYSALSNYVSNPLWRNKINQDYKDPSEPLKEYSHYLAKIHRDYDK